MHLSGGASRKCPVESWLRRKSPTGSRAVDAGRRRAVETVGHFGRWFRGTVCQAPSKLCRRAPGQSGRRSRPPRPTLGGRHLAQPRSVRLTARLPPTGRRPLAPQTAGPLEAQAPLSAPPAPIRVIPAPTRPRLSPAMDARPTVAPFVACCRPSESLLYPFRPPLRCGWHFLPHFLPIRKMERGRPRTLESSYSDASRNWKSSFQASGGETSGSDDCDRRDCIRSETEATAPSALSCKSVTGTPETRIGESHNSAVKSAECL
jgi:hypothetical protein